MEKKRAVFKRPVRKVTEESRKRVSDLIVAEEPFTVVWQSSDGRSERLASTMRTPGDDMALASGMMFSEGLVKAKDEISTLSFCVGGGVNELNRVKAELRIPLESAEHRLRHRPSQGVPQSACGMCGLDDLAGPRELIKWAASRYSGTPVEPTQAQLERGLILLAKECPLFAKTGASHACVILGEDGEALSVAEDVGRHNACDKAVGKLFMESKGDFQLPADSGIIFSSRLSFELASKALAAGAAWMASVGAPTHLAVEAAGMCGVPLVGFLSEVRHNLYTL